MIIWPVILIAVFLLPFFSPEVYKESADTLYKVLAISLLLFTLKKREYLKDKRILFPLAAWLSVVLVTCIFCAYPAAALSHAFNFFLYAIVFAVVTAMGYDQKRQIAFVLIFCSVLISARAIAQHLLCFDKIIPYILNERPALTGRELLFVLDMVERRRAISVFPTPNQLAVYLAMVNLLAIGTLFSQRPLLRNKAVAVALLGALLINSYCMWLTRSVAGTASLVFGVFLFYLFMAQKKQQEKRRYTVYFFVFLAVVIVALLFILMINRYSDRSMDNLAFSLEGRAGFWRAALQIIRNSPLSFHGLGNFGGLFLQYAPAARVKSIMTHNLILQLWVETGIYGIIALIWFIVSVILAAVSRIREAGADISGAALFFAGALSGACAFLFHEMAGFCFFSPQTAFIWWILCGLSIKCDHHCTLTYRSHLP